MRLIALDTEFNQPSGKTIEIGAICFQPDNGKIIDTFQTCVNPGEIINPEITELTSISDTLVENCPNISQAAQLLTDFKIKHQINPIPIVWGAGLSNDVRRIYDEAGLESPFGVRIIDAKATYQMLANVSNADMRTKVGLAKACGNIGIGWNYTYGVQHGALADAYNTFRIYMTLSKCLKQGFDSKKLWSQYDPF